MSSELAHAVLVSGELEQRMGETLQAMSDRGFDVSSADLLKLHLQQTDLSVWTNMLSGSMAGIYAPLKEAAAQLS